MSRLGIALSGGADPAEIVELVKLVEDLGYESAAEAWSRGDRPAAERAVSDALIDATSIAGTPEPCRGRIEAYRRSGIDLPILSPYARGAGAKARFRAIRACAPSRG